MSLIPSESLNFPDSFRAKEGWHLTDTIEDSPGQLHEGEGAESSPVVPSVEPTKSTIEPPTPSSLTASEPTLPTPITAEREVDNPQPELPNISGEDKPTDSLPATADLHALLGHFLSAGAVQNRSVESPNGESPLPADGAIDQKENELDDATTLAGATGSSPNDVAVTTPAPAGSLLPTHTESPTAGMSIAAGPSSEQAILAALQSLSHMEAEPPAGTVVVETPAQAQHIMEVIAAAVQRGALRGETVPEPAPSTVILEEQQPTSASTVTSEEPSLPAPPIPPIVTPEESPFPPAITSEEPPSPPPLFPPIVKSEEPSPPPPAPLTRPPPKVLRLDFSISPTPVGELDAPLTRPVSAHSTRPPEIQNPPVIAAPSTPAPVSVEEPPAPSTQTVVTPHPLEIPKTPVTVAAAAAAASVPPSAPAPAKEPPVPIPAAEEDHAVPEISRAPVTAEPALSAPVSSAPSVEPVAVANPAVVVQTAPGAETSKVPITAAPLGTSPDVPKVPAKIRITPRKIKPRPQVQPMAEGPVTLQPLDYSYQGHVSHETNTNVVHDDEAEQDAVLQTRSPVAEPTRPDPLPPRPELSARKIAAARLELAQADLFLPSAKERRNRLIGFGLCELAAVAALVFLARFAFTHHFPDSTIKILVFILVFAAAGVAIALPIAYMRNDPRRWERANE